MMSISPTMPMSIKIVTCLKTAVKLKETRQKMLNIKTEVENQTWILMKEIQQKRK